MFCADDESLNVNAEEARRIAAQRALLAAVPKPSMLPEDAFPSESLGGRCLDKWGYRWGQRSNDLWLYMMIPPECSVSDVNVKFSPHRIGIFFREVALYDCMLWNFDERQGIDQDTAAWVIVHHDGKPVLHVEMYKKKPGWWKAIWHDHPTIEPWEIPDWKTATFSDGYHELT